MIYESGVAKKKTHNEQFAELQEQYLKTRSGEHLSRMYLLCIDIASNYIAKYARVRRLELDVAELSHDSAVFVIEQYLRKPEFRVNRISAYMHFGCIKNLYHDAKRDYLEVSYEKENMRISDV
jgi:hypothetical protein